MFVAEAYVSSPDGFSQSRLPGTGSRTLPTLAKLNL
jgi:hypothetical protein